VNPEQIIQWNILEKETVEGIIFKTINPGNPIMLKLMSQAGMRISGVLKLTPNNTDGRKPLSGSPEATKTENQFKYPKDPVTG